ncbi:MAG TPA: aminomethyltransferase beta-barrel domain-containing protein [Paludibacter sp.]
MYKREFLIRNVNMIDKSLFTSEFDIFCRIRYRKQNTLSRVVFLENNTAKVELSEPLEAIAPGQTAVFYRDGKVLGGGFIS